MHSVSCVFCAFCDFCAFCVCTKDDTNLWCILDVALAFKYICSAKLKFQREAHARQRQLYLASVSAPQPVCKVRPFLLHDLDWCFQEMCEGSKNLRIQVQTKTVHSNTCQDFMCLSFKIADQDSRQQTKQNCLSATWLCPKNHLTASHPWKRNHFPGERFLRGVMMPSCKIFPWLSPDHSSYFGSQNLPQKPSSNLLNKRNMLVSSASGKATQLFVHRISAISETSTLEGFEASVTSKHDFEPRSSGKGQRGESSVNRYVWNLQKPVKACQSFCFSR